MLATRDDIVLTTKVGYDITAERKFPGQSERPHDWRPESVRQQCDESLRRLGIDHIDLYQLHNTRIEPILADDLWDALLDLQQEGKVRELGVALGPAIGWVEEGNRAIDDRPIASLQTVFNVLEQEPGLTFAARPRVQRGEVEPDLARAARLRHALGQGHPRHRVRPQGPPLAPQPRQHARQLREGRDAARSSGHAETGRTIGQAAIAAILANPAFTTVLPERAHGRRRARVRGGVGPAAHRRRAARHAEELWARNFDHEDRYVMPLKSSV